MKRVFAVLIFAASLAIAGPVKQVTTGIGAGVVHIFHHPRELAPNPVGHPVATSKGVASGVKSLAVGAFKVVKSLAW